MRHLDKRILNKTDIQTVITCDEFYVGDRGWFGVSAQDFYDLDNTEIFEGVLLGIDDNYDYCFITKDKEGNMRQFPYFVPFERVSIKQTIHIKTFYRDFVSINFYFNKNLT